MSSLYYAVLAHRSLDAWEAEEDVGPAPVRHLLQHVHELLRVARLERKKNVNKLRYAGNVILVVVVLTHFPLTAFMAEKSILSSLTVME